MTLSITPFESTRGERVITAGQNTAAQISSLKYFIRSIQLCESLTLSSGTYTDASNCFTFFTSLDQLSYAYTLGSDYSNLATIARADSSHFVDLLSSDSRAELNRTYYFQRGNVRSYNWLVITWYPVQKVTASLTINDIANAITATYRTHDGATSMVNNQFFRTLSTGNFVTGVAEEAVVVSTLDRDWYRLQNPFTLSNEDVDSERAFILDLKFNLEGLIRGFSSGTSSRSNSIRDASGNEMSLSHPRFLPLPRRASETLKREKYLFTSGSAAPAAVDAFNLQLDILSIAEDSTSAIYGAEAQVQYRLYGVESSLYTVTDVPEAPKIASIVTNADGTLNFKLSDGSVFIQNWARKDTVGQTGTATIHCSNTGWTYSGCSHGSSVTMQYTLQALQ